MKEKTDAGDATYTKGKRDLHRGELNNKETNQQNALILF